MRILFLDFDGVLNSERWVKRNQDKFKSLEWRMTTAIDPEAVAHLNKIVAATACKVVISSTWRIMHELPKLRAILKQHGFQYSSDVIDRTPSGLSSSRRGHEIAHWLNEHGPIDGIVIIDDDSDMEHLRHKLVQTSWVNGLMDDHVEPAIRMLLEPL